MPHQTSVVESTSNNGLVAAIRTALEPLAAELCEKAGVLASSNSGKDAVLDRDLAKLLSESSTFLSELPLWFPDDAEHSSEEISENRLRSSRHDARNRLNHLFGIIQLIRMGYPPAPVLESSIEVVALLESCLKALSHQTDSDNSAGSAHPQSVTTSRDPGSAGHLLVADDDEENRSILKRLLEPHGFRISFAVNGVEVIETMSRSEFDAVLLDIQMPEMDGFEVLSRLRETGQLRNTPVIVVTGLQEEQDAVRCI